MPVKIKDPFHSIIEAQDRSAHAVVDHYPQFFAPPKDVRPDSYHYLETVLQSKDAKKIHSFGQPGASPKVFVRTGDAVKYMLKPYHQGIHPRTAPYMRYPIQGWSEMATQALYHAGGIGHLVQRSHVAMHEDHKHQEHPLLATKLDEKANTPISQMAAYRGPYPSELMNNAVRVGMMDFLTNHNDRNEDNLLFQPEPFGPPHRLLAIDNQAAFQYKVPNRFDRITDKKDHLFYYIGDSRGMRPLTNGHDRFLWSNAHLNDGVHWWKANSQNVRKELEGQLQAILHPRVRQYIHDNFMTRADALDQLANEWDHRESEAEDYNPYIEGPKHGTLMVPMVPFYHR